MQEQATGVVGRRALRQRELGDLHRLRVDPGHVRRDRLRVPLAADAQQRRALGRRALDELGKHVQQVRRAADHIHVAAATDIPPDRHRRHRRGRSVQPQLGHAGRQPGRHSVRPPAIGVLGRPRRVGQARRAIRREGRSGAPGAARRPSRRRRPRGDNDEGEQNGPSHMQCLTDVPPTRQPPRPPERGGSRSAGCLSALHGRSTRV